MTDIAIRTEGRAGRITLARPQALNALTHAMVRAIDAALRDWADDPAVALVLIDAEGERAFCAGGDIADVYRSGRRGDFDAGRRFWADEYRMNARIAALPEALCRADAGLRHGRRRRRLRPRQPPHRRRDHPGRHARMHDRPHPRRRRQRHPRPRPRPPRRIPRRHRPPHVPRRRHPRRLRRPLRPRGPLARRSRRPSPPPATPPPSPPSPSRRRRPPSPPLAEAIDDAFEAADLAALTARLETSDWGHGILKTLRRQCPLSMACTLELVRAARRDPGVAKALAREYRFTSRACSRRRVPRRRPRRRHRQGPHPGLARRHGHPAPRGGRRDAGAAGRGRARPSDPEGTHAHRLHRPRQHGRPDGAQPRRRRPRRHRLRHRRPVAVEGVAPAASAAEAARDRTPSSPCSRAAPSCAPSTPRSSPPPAPARSSSTAPPSTSPAPAPRGRGGAPPASSPSTRPSPAAPPAPPPARSPSWSAAPPEAFETARPLLDVMGSRAIHCGAGRRRPGGEDLQQHDARHLDDRRLRGLRAGRQARPRPARALRRGLHLLRRLLVGDELLPGARRRPDLAGRPRLRPGLRRRADAQGPDPRPGGRRAPSTPPPRSAPTPSRLYEAFVADGGRGRDFSAMLPWLAARTVVASSRARPPAAPAVRDIRLAARPHPLDRAAGRAPRGSG